MRDERPLKPRQAALRRKLGVKGPVPESRTVVNTAVRGEAAGLLGRLIQQARGADQRRSS